MDLFIPFDLLPVVLERRCKSVLTSPDIVRNKAAESRLIFRLSFEGQLVEQISQ